MARTPISRPASIEKPALPPGGREPRMIQGKEMSFNNYLDAESAWRLVNDLSRPGVVIVKHNNPCGVAIGDDLATAFLAAWDSDPARRLRREWWLSIDPLTLPPLRRSPAGSSRS